MNLRQRNNCLPLPRDWTAEQALAVHEFLADLTEAVWQQYEDPMLELLHGEERQDKDEQPDLFGFTDSMPF